MTTTHQMKKPGRHPHEAQSGAGPKPRPEKTRPGGGAAWLEIKKRTEATTIAETDTHSNEEAHRQLQQKSRNKEKWGGGKSSSPAENSQNSSDQETLGKKVSKVKNGNLLTRRGAVLARKETIGNGGPSEATKCKEKVLGKRGKTRPECAARIKQNLNEVSPMSPQVVPTKDSWGEDEVESDRGIDK